MYSSKSVFFFIKIVACLGNDRRRDVVSESNESEKAIYMTKIRLVESVIMNNASSALIILGESVSRRYRYYIGKRGMIVATVEGRLQLVHCMQ